MVKDPVTIPPSDDTLPSPTPIPVPQGRINFKLCYDDVDVSLRIGCAGIHLLVFDDDENPNTAKKQIPMTDTDIDTLIEKLKEMKSAALMAGKT